MAKKRIDVEIGSRNKVAAGLKQATASIKRFANNVGALIKRLAVGMVALGTATAAFGVRAVKAFMVQEEAEKALAEAMAAHGDAVESLIPKHKALAAAIQDETGISDESTIALMAKLRTIGVANNQMEQAVKLTYALAKAGMREKTAFRAAADALNGNTTQLTTYIPELRQATTESEKLAIVNDLMVRGYAQLTGELNTNAGRWKELKGRIGDFMESIGRAIVENASFQDVLKRVSARIKELTESGAVDRWATQIVSALKSVASAFNGMIAIVKQIIAMRFEIMWVALAGAMGVAAVRATALSVSLYGVGKAAVVAAGGLGTMIRHLMSQPILGMAAVFAASAFAVKNFAQAIWESNQATLALIKSQKDLKAVEKGSMEKYGTRNAETLRRIRTTMRSGTDKEKETVERMFPEAAAAWKKSSATSVKPTVETAKTAAIMRPTISKDTSMLSESDLFTMMQAGTGAKRETELTELQEINKGIQELIDVTGGVE